MSSKDLDIELLTRLQNSSSSFFSSNTECDPGDNCSPNGCSPTNNCSPYWRSPSSEDSSPSGSKGL